MNEIIEGYSYQEFEPTPDNPCEIKTIDLVEYNNLYLETNHYGRSQFVKEILILRQQLEEQKKLNEEHQRINGELREEIKELENIIDNARNYVENNQSGGTDKNGMFHLNFDGDICELYEMLKRF